MEYRHTDLSRKKDSKRLRTIVGIGLPAVGVLIAWIFWNYNPSDSASSMFFLFCPFNRLTGLYCPGCGMTRAAHELIHFNILNGIRDNALIVLVIGPAIAYCIFREYVNYILDRKILPVPPVANWMIIVLVTLIISFTILRNIPMTPFIYLTPAV